MFPNVAGSSGYVELHAQPNSDTWATRPGGNGRSRSIDRLPSHVDLRPEER